MSDAAHALLGNLLGTPSWCMTQPQEDTLLLSNSERVGGDSSSVGQGNHAWRADTVGWDPLKLACGPPMDGGPAGGDTVEQASRTYSRGQRPRCQVPGCRNELQARKAYEMRTKICSKHQRACSVPSTAGRGGDPERFCQSCHQLHPLAAFKGAAHSCAAKLAHLAHVRALRRAERAVFSDVPTDGDPLFQLLRTESYPGSSGECSTAGVHAEGAGSPANTGPVVTGSLDGDTPCLDSALFGAWPWGPQEGGLSLELKLQVPSPLLLPASGLRADVDALGDELLVALGGDDFGPMPADLGLESMVAGSIHPGCVLLVLDFDAPLGIWNKLQARGGHNDGGASLLARAACKASRVFASRLDGGDAAAAIRLSSHGEPRLLAKPAAVSNLSPAPITLTVVEAATPLAEAPLAVRCRLNGRPVDVHTSQREGGSVTIHLGSTHGREGVALFDVDEEPHAAARPGRRLTAVLLSSQSEVIAEVNATAAALETRFGRNPEAKTVFDGAVWALGCALAVARDKHVQAASEQLLSVHRRKHVLQEGAAAALRFGWRAALQECLQGLQATSKALQAIEPESGASMSTLLHQAAAGAGWQAVSALLKGADPHFRGTPTSPDADGRTPLHIAAAAASADALLPLCADVDGGAPAALLSFTCDADRHGRTAAQIVLSSECTRTVSVARSLVDRVNAGIMVANTIHASSHTDSRDEACRIAALMLDQAVANAAVVLADQHAAWARARGARFVHALYAMVHGCCIFLRPPSRIHDAAEIAQFKAALPCPPWTLWQQVPTSMCCASNSWLVLPRYAILLLAALLLYMPGPKAMALRAAGGRTATAAIVLCFFLIVDPTFTAFATYARYDTLTLRQPALAYLRILTFAAATHGLLDHCLPVALYAPIMCARAVLPLLTRAAQAMHMTGPLPRMRLLSTHTSLDVLHAIICFFSVLHTSRVRSRQAHVSRAMKQR